MSRYFTKKLGPNQFESILKEKLGGIPGRYIPGETLTEMAHNDEILCDAEEHLFAMINKDLSKVEFDQENFSSDQVYGNGHIGESLVGIHTLENGLTFLGINAGGDWEVPVFFIVYWDGKKLRGYIPEGGNTWCKEEKCAWGSQSQEVSQEFIDSLHFNFDWIKQDILERVQYKE